VATEFILECPNCQQAWGADSPADQAPTEISGIPRHHALDQGDSHSTETWCPAEGGKPRLAGTRTDWESEWPDLHRGRPIPDVFPAYGAFIQISFRD
jgi:hypothetical protein